MEKDPQLVNSVFERLSTLYMLQSDAAIARLLKVPAQNMPRYRQTGNLPYRQIIENTTPENWSWIFQAKALKLPKITVEKALKVLTEAGFRVTIEKP
jgi:hypothetical protein